MSASETGVVMELARYVRTSLEYAGYTVQESKWTIGHRGGTRRVHGLNVNDCVLSLPKSARKELRDEVRRVEKFGCTQTEWSELMGRLGYFARIHSRSGEKAKAWLGAVVPRTD